VAACAGHARRRARAGVDHIPLQQGTRHSIFTTLGQAFPEVAVE
jgi:hypothetical protein